MKLETSTSDHSLRVQLRVYLLALLLATFIAVLHAGILFGLADFLRLFRVWAQPILVGRLADPSCRRRSYFRALRSAYR
jgi:hypothetical protein